MIDIDRSTQFEASKVLMHQLAVLPKQLLNDACLDKFKIKMAPA
jgi:hypothetical protein